VRILVVAEIRLYREGAADALMRLDGIDHVDTAATGPSALMAARRTACDIVLMDMSVEDSTGIVGSMMTAMPSLKVVALGVKEDSPEVVECAEAGIAGYVPRDASLADLGEVLRGVLRGEAACSGKVAAGLLRHIALQARARRAGLSARQFQLTRREQEVLRLLEGGLTNKEIARALGIELSTVKNHVHNLLAKSGARGRADMVGVMDRLEAVAATLRSG
jgi:DNA-binding NarL/FixJ family response regulator